MRFEKIQRRFAAKSGVGRTAEVDERGIHQGASRLRGSGLETRTLAHRGDEMRLKRNLAVRHEVNLTMKFLRICAATLAAACVICACTTPPSVMIRRTI